LIKEATERNLLLSKPAQSGTPFADPHFENHAIQRFHELKLRYERDSFESGLLPRLAELPRSQAVWFLHPYIGHCLQNPVHRPINSP
jgi:hypothetical protein